MTNDFTAVSPAKRGEVWEPVCPLDGGLLHNSPDIFKVLGERHQQNLFQELEDARLGKVLVKAWTGCYKSADEVIEDVRLSALKIGFTICEDDVDIGEKWEDVFEVRNGELIFKSYSV